MQWLGCQVIGGGGAFMLNEGKYLISLERIKTKDTSSSGDGGSISVLRLDYDWLRTDTYNVRIKDVNIR